jgi:hypothetical protein
MTKRLIKALEMYRHYQGTRGKYEAYRKVNNSLPRHKQKIWDKKTLEVLSYLQKIESEMLAHLNKLKPAEYQQFEEHQV